MKTSKAELYIDGIFHESRPIYSDDISIDKERESGEMFRRTKLNSSFTFVRDDFDTIYNSSINSEFEIRVKDKETDILLARGVFQKTDCTFNLDDRTCTVDVTSADEYDKILNGKDNEYDLVTLAPPKESITLKKRPVIQYYVLGDNKVTNVVGNTSFEMDTNMVITHEADITGERGTEYYGFSHLTDWEKIDIKFNDGTNEKILFPNAEGTYWKTKINATTWQFTNSDGYYFRKTTSSAWFAALMDKNGTRLEPATNTYIAVPIETPPDYTATSPIYRNNMQHEDVATVGVATYVAMFLEARIIHDKPNYGGSIDIPTEDIVANNMNYHYAIPALRFLFRDIKTLADYTIDSTETSETPTKYMQNSKGRYFVKPTTLEGQPIPYQYNVIPVGWNQWIPASFWLVGNADNFNTLDVALAIPSELKDAYPLWGAIKTLLGQIDPTINFEGTAAYSQFLYGQITQSELSGWVKNLLYITPITNVKKTYYNQAARKGKITLGQIFDMLRATCQLYWFIDTSGGEKKLRIEHISWFKNGGNYTQLNPLVDLTTIKSFMSQKAWSFGINTFNYDKSALVKRYEFAWANDVSEPFNGLPIDIKNPYVGNGQTNKAAATNFISDVDIIMAAPNQLTDDCYAVIGTNISKACPIVQVSNQGMDILCPTFLLQNGYLSYLFTELIYWVYDMGGSNAETTEYENSDGDNGVIDVIDTQRIKTQRIKFPIVPSKVGKEGLYKTAVGVGEWVTSKYTPEDGMVEAEIIMPI